MRKEIHKIVGIKDGEIQIITSIFDHGDMSGVTGAVLVPLTQDEVDQRNDIEYLSDFLKGSGTELRKGQTWEELAQECLEESEREGKYFAFQDDSYIYDVGEKELFKFMEQIGRDNVVTFECVGGGRIFDALEEIELKKRFA